MTIDARFDDTLNSLLQLCGSWVANTVEPEYRAGLAKTYGMAVDGTRCVVRGRSDHVVDMTAWTCDCRFCATLKLPCRHVVFVRRTRGLIPAIPLPYVHQRWLLRPVQDEDVNVLAVPFMITKDDAVSAAQYRKRLEPRQKYTIGLRLFERIASELSELGQDSFEGEMRALEEYHGSLRANRLGQLGQIRARLQPASQPASQPDPQPASKQPAPQPASQPDPQPASKQPASQSASQPATQV